MERDEEITLSSGNVFADLDLPNPEERLLKAQLAILIKRFIKNKGWTQAQAAEVIGIEQPKVSQIFRGQLGGISVERLMNIVNRLGHDIEVRVSVEEREEAQLMVRVG